MEVQDETPLLPTAADGDAPVALQTIRKLDRRVLMLCAGIILFAYADRSNIGYAAKDLCNDLELTHGEYGIGVSLFFFGYLTTQPTSNLMVKRFGAPTWLGFTMLTWGVVAASAGFVQTSVQFYIQRVLLGAAEGGNIPSINYFLSLFYPKEHATGAFSLIVSAICFSMPFFAPISTGLLSLGPVVGLTGWRLLLVVEGLIQMVYSVVIYTCLPRNLESASFLEPEEKEWIAAGTAEMEDVTERSFNEEVKIVLTNPSFCITAAMLFIAFGIASVLMFWATLIIHDMLPGEDDDEDSKTCGSKDGNAAVSIILAAIPYLYSGLMCLWAKVTTITNRSRFCAAVNAFGAILLISWVGTRQVSFALGFITLTLSVGTGFIAEGPSTSLALSFFASSTKATAAALFNVLACVGGVVFPPIVGKTLDEYGYGIAIPLCGAFLMVAAILILSVRDPQAQQEKTQISQTSEINLP